ncbi:hypothetical protein [Streptacidiphilus fuscans]|uniref:Uncharacterized protein n=1 Tax=Streptacidiphilus fuscans TaxID=2789292 RepID=A0A931B490_9ACTN|nr:hypothetical protein [Streptacidiphilus fuscans]MBF9070844.1 hypothetical protein [Streptacidiphilus fuscans]
MSTEAFPPPAETAASAGPVVPAVPGEPGPAGAVGATDGQPRRRGRLVALAAAFVLSAVAVGGGTGALILATRSSSTTSSAAASSAASPAAPTYGVRADGSHFGTLDQLLLPVPTSDQPGPDDRTFGNDTVLTPSQYASAFTAEYRFLSAGNRSTLGSELGLSGLQGYALRSYADPDDGLSAEITLIQEKPGSSAASTALTTLRGATAGDGGGPSVSGFPHAHCYLPPDPYGSSFGVLRCDDAEGDLLITMQVEGVAPLAQAAAADLFRQQLSRLATPAAQV